MMQTLLDQTREPSVRFRNLSDCIEAVETYNSQANKLIASSLKAGEAVHNICALKRWQEMGLTGFEALCKKLGWTRSNCYELRHGWEMYLEFNDCIPAGIQVAGAYAWAQLYKVHKNRRRLVLGKAIALSIEDNGEITGPLIQKLDKPEIKAPQLKILSSIGDLTRRQEAEELAIEKARKRGRCDVESRDCHEAIEELSQVESSLSLVSSDKESVDAGVESQLGDRPTLKGGRKGKPTGKNYDELLATTQKIFAVNEELKGQIQQMRGDMKKLTDSYEEKLALMQQELNRLAEENERLRSSASQESASQLPERAVP